MSKRVLKSVETKTEEVRIAETKGGRKEARKERAEERRKEENKTKKEKDNGSKQDDRRIVNLE